MNRSLIGEYQESTTLGETVRAFVPPNLPPLPALNFSPGTQPALDRALLTLGRLDGVATTLPDADLLLYTFVRKGGGAVIPNQGNGCGQKTMTTEALVPTKLPLRSARICSPMTH